MTATPPAFGDDDYGSALTRLLPRGRAWRTDTGAILRASLYALAPTYARSTAAAAQVLVDASPATTENLLDEWEESLGLPDPCTPLNPTIAQRQASVRAKFASRGSLSIGYFTQLAANLGQTVTITEFAPFTAEMAADLPDCGPDWAFAWEVDSPGFLLSYFEADSAVADDPLSAFDGGELACRIARDAPAGTILIFPASA